MRIFLFICLLLIALPAAAQETLPPVPNSEDIHPAARYDFTSGPRYEKMIDEALKRPPDFDFANFRILYGMTRAYDPLADDTQRRLLTLSESVKKAATPDDEKKALAEYTGALLTHLANIDVVSMALVLGEQDRRFGDPKFFKWIYHGLLNSIIRTGDGTSLQRAYDVVTVGEEIALLHKLNVSVISTSSEHEGVIYYNMHEVEDIVSGARRTIFVDTTKPMVYFEWEKERKARTISLPKQQ